MSKTKWTPGPWTAENVCGEFHRIYGRNPNGGQLNIARTMYPNDEESMANAYLLAAAPDLYEALKLARRLLQEHHSVFIMRPENQTCPVCTPNPFFKIDSALAKARGESQ